MFGYCSTFSIRLRLALGLVGSVAAFLRKTAQNGQYFRMATLWMHHPNSPDRCLFGFFGGESLLSPLYCPEQYKVLSLPVLSYVSPFLRCFLSEYWVSAYHRIPQHTTEQQRGCRKITEQIWIMLTAFETKPGERWGTALKCWSCRKLPRHLLKQICHITNKWQSLIQGGSSISSWAHKTKKKETTIAIMWENRMVIAPNCTSRTTKDKRATNSLWIQSRPHKTDEFVGKMHSLCNDPPYGEVRQDGKISKPL